MVDPALAEKRKKRGGINLKPIPDEERKQRKVE